MYKLRSRRDLAHFFGVTEQEIDKLLLPPPQIWIRSGKNGEAQYWQCSDIYQWMINMHEHWLISLAALSHDEIERWKAEFRDEEVAHG